MQSLYNRFESAYDAQNPLPSWRGENKSAILQFVRAVSDEASAQFVPAPQRISVFDNDGTLWCEQHVPIQIQFAISRFGDMVKIDPSLADTPALKAGAKGDIKGLLSHGLDDALELVLTTHAGMTPEEFYAIARDWYETAVHSESQIPIRNLIYAPMIELLVHLAQNGFTNYIASAGGLDFMRAISLNRYGVPPERVIGSEFKTRYELHKGEMQIVRNSEIVNFDDKKLKPVNIQRRIGQRPIFAFGNSDGDYQMLEWVSAHHLPHMELLLHHTDAVREYAYDEKALSGALEAGLKDASKFGWRLVDMKLEWSQVYVDNSTN